jgi:NADH-quinone oxidoreductase subunit C
MVDDTAAGADGDARENEHEQVEAEPMVHGAPVTESLGQTVLHPSREQLVDVVTALADDGYLMCLDVTGVDYLLDPPRELPARVDGERFEVVITLMAHARAERIRLRVQVPESDPTCPSLVGLHAGAEANERETYDMFGIVFDGHPDPSRILMPEGWDGHPLRKDDGVGAIPVQFKGAGREVRS